MSRNLSEKFPKSDNAIALGSCIFDIAAKELRDENGQNILLRDQSTRVLSALADNKGQTVSKDDLVNTVWNETFVTDDSLVQCISEIRKAIGDTDHKIIQTFPKIGYRLIAQEKADNIGPSHQFKWWKPALVAACFLVFGGFAFWALSPTADDKNAPVIAILAFDDLSNGDDKGFLSDAIAEGITTELSRFNELSVIARNSSFKYRGKPTDIRTIGTELGAHYILEGSQQKQGERLRITAQLIDARSGEHIWADSFDGKIAEIFQMQSRIVQTVASSVGFKITYDLPPVSNLSRFSALRYHLEGRKQFLSISKEKMLKAGELNLKAIDADPTSIYGYLGLVYVHRNNAVFGWSKQSYDKTLKLATQYAEKALAIDPNNYLAHHARGTIHQTVGELDEAIIRFKKSISLNPNSPNVNMALASTLIYQGTPAEALDHIQRAMKNHPHHPQWFHITHAFAYWALEDCQNAMLEVQKMAKTPAFAYPWVTVIQICVGKPAEAKITMAKLVEKRPTHTLAKERANVDSKFKSPKMLNRWLDALRVAGLPEG